jgi:hypothetical protein
VTEARRIYSEAEASSPGGVTGGRAIAPVRVNLIVAEAPFSAATLMPTSTRPPAASI